MTRIVRILAVLAIVGAGMTAAITGVLAFEAQVVKVNTSISNAIDVDTSPVNFGSSFPEEFRQDFFTVDLSSSFEAASARVQSADIEVYVECAPDLPSGPGDTLVHWMGDFAYLAKTDPGFQLPGGKDVVDATGVDIPAGSDNPAGGDPPRKQTGPIFVNTPWEYVGGNADDYDVCATSTSKRGVFTDSGKGGGPISLATGGPGAELHMAIDIPVCLENLHSSTDPNPKPSGWNAPTRIIHPINFPDESDPVDPRHPTATGNSPASACAYNAGMTIVLQVVRIDTTGAATSGNEAPVFTVLTADITGTLLADTPLNFSVSVTDDHDVVDASFLLGIDWTIDGSSTVSGVGATFSTTALAFGTTGPHTVEATVTDSGGLTRVIAFPVIISAS